ncbi:hypothetical protein ACUY1T_21925 [Billgrantia sp. Q4P2]|uniref:hypothetical protein n=1 Tax=Billgrantia sp. Q4P2 TaxID=3463857 RepID=UPI0040560B40
MKQEIAVIAKDDHRRFAVLLGRASPLLPLMIGFGTPILISICLISQAALLIPLWPLSNFNLMLLTWAVAWACYMAWTGQLGLHHNVYLFFPDESRLLHVNSGEEVDLMANSRPSAEKNEMIEWSLPANREDLANMGWERLDAIETKRPVSLKEILTRKIEWGTVLMFLAVPEIILIVILIASESLSAFFVSHLLLLGTWLTLRLTEYWFQWQLPNRAMAAVNASLDNGMRYEA